MDEVGDDAAEERLLRAWGAAFEIGDGFLDWLVGEASPEERHLVADGWNWDVGCAPLRWIVTRADCDRGTALLVFWRALPDEELDWPGRVAGVVFDPAPGELVALIRARDMAGGYPRAAIAFDLEGDEIWRMAEAVAGASAAAVEANTPARMRGPVVGRRVVGGAGYEEGVPVRFRRSGATL